MRFRNCYVGFCRHAAVVLTTVLISITVCVPASAADITIGIIGDQTGASDVIASYRLLQSGVDALNAQNPDVVIHVGDLVESNNPPESVRFHFEQATGILGGLKSKWYLTPGDHDVNPESWRPDSPDRRNELLFRSLYAMLNPLVKDNFYYSFDVRGYHFVSLYALEHLRTDPRWGNVFFSGISDNQFDWLKKDLASMIPGTRGVIVFVHQPLWYNWSDWERVHNMLRDYPMVAVIAGHFHYGQIERHDFPYITVGATGGLQHVTIVAATGRNVAVNAIPLTTKQRIDLPLRSRMDRIQAVDSGLDNGYIGKVFLSNGRLVGDCATKSPAVITLRAIGNPTNFSGTLALSLATPEVVILNPTYDKTICNKVSLDGMTCVMAANAGIYYSNTSIIGPDPSKEYTWKGTLKSLKHFDIKTLLKLYARFSYGIANDPDYVGKSFRVPVEACSDSVPR